MLLRCGQGTAQGPRRFRVLGCAFDSVIDRMHHFFTTASGDAMRTTFTLDDDAAAIAQNFARANALRLGQAVSELIRRASAPPMKMKKKGDVWVIQAPAGAPKLTSEQVKNMTDELI